MPSQVEQADGPAVVVDPNHWKGFGSYPEFLGKRSGTSYGSKDCLGNSVSAEGNHVVQSSMFVSETRCRFGTYGGCRKAFSLGSCTSAPGSVVK